MIKGLNDTLQAAKTVLKNAAGDIVAAENAILGTVIDGNPATVETPAMTQALADAKAAYELLVEPTGAHAVAFDALEARLTLDGLTITDNGTINVLNQSPDIGLSPAFNSWMTIFGQFFDHGLDLVSKGGNGTVYVPLLPDDPLYVPGSATNFMVMTRATQFNGPGADGVLGTADDTSHETVNSTTPFVDQNQTYTSHPSHQVFLREYALDGAGMPVSTGRLLHGAHGEGTWADVKAQASQMLGIQLVDLDVHNAPLLATDRYGEFIRGANGFVQIVTTTGLVEGDPAANGGLGVLLPANTIRTDHAFLNDIAHGAAPGMYDANPDPSPGAVNLQPKVGDADTFVGSQPNPNYNPNLPVGPNNSPIIEQAANTYDNELLDRHFITGDGRGNENIGLTAVHTIFHSEHNRLVEDYKHTILRSGDAALINEWLRSPLTEPMPTDEAGIDALVATLNASNAWDGERLFQAGRFVNEMQYQHMVFEEFARAVQPGIDPFVFSNTPDIDPSIMAEFAHVVYRFGHSMLTEDITRINSDMSSDDIGLIAAFLNPLEFDKDGAVSVESALGSIVRGMSRDTGNEIDEFVTEALRNNLVGLPLDLAVLNIARARDTGMPGFNAARAAFYAATGDSQLAPFNSWVDMVPELKNPTSIINFIAAYGTHSSILNAGTLADKRTAATNLVFGTAGETATETADRQAFLNGGTDSNGFTWTAASSGLNDVDFWIGGLAERKNEFGGMLGATFNYVFETQLEKLQNGDRFYYLSRTQGTNLLNELEANTFSKIVMRNSDLGDAGSSHLSSLVFQTPDHILELNVAKQIGADPIEENPILQLLHPKVIRNNPNTVGEDTNYLRFTGGEHVVLGGTAGDDILRGGNGIDTLWGDAGNDRLDGGNEADQVHGGDGDDIITDAGTPVGGSDFLHGDEGNDVISGGMGFDLVFGGGGSDFVIGGQDFFEVFGGRGDDFIMGSSGPDFLLGNEGNDWIEGGDGLDGLAGENSELFFNSPIIGHDVLNGQGNDTDYDGESGDDIMIQTTGITRSNGMFGFDWASHKGDSVAADSDLGIAFFPAQQAFTLRDRFDSVEGLSGWNMNDVLTGARVLRGAAGGGGAGPGNPVDESHLKAGNIGLIDGFEAFLGMAPGTAAAMDANATVLDTTQGAEIIIGGGGSDRIQGNLGNDRLDGDVWLNTRIGITGMTGPNAITSAEGMNEIKARMLSGEINPSQLHIVRELVSSATAAADVDTAVFKGALSEYTIGGLDANNKLIDPNGWITVTHNALGLQTDGVDTIRHFERLQFADQTISISTTNTNSIAMGTISIAGLLNIGGLFSPTEGGTLTVDAATNFADLDTINQSTVLYTWQVLQGGGGIVGNGSWTNVATGQTFTPTQNEVGQPMRLMVTFTDGSGVPETLFSPATGPVGNTNAAPTGAPTIVQAPLATENSLLSVNTGSIVDADGIVGGSFTYQWNVTDVGTGITEATGATGETFTPDDAQVGKRISVTVSYTDGGGVIESVTSTLTNPVINVNDAPVLLDYAPDQTVDEDSSISIDLPTTQIFDSAGDLVTVPVFADADLPHGDTLTYSFTATQAGNSVDLSSWLGINPSTGRLTGTPTNSEVGSYQISIQATDTAGAQANFEGTLTPLDFTLTVSNVNDAPAVAAALVAQSATEDAAFSFAVPAGTFADVDAGDTLTLSATLANGDPLPSWLSFDGTTFTGTPVNGDVGAIEVRVTGTDSAMTSSSSDFTLTVANTNDTPTLAAALVAQSATEDAAFSFAVPAGTFADVDAGDTLTLSATLANGDPLPSWLSFDGTTFTGTPVNGDVGAIEVRVTGTDSAMTSSSSDFTLTVANTNDAPALTGPQASLTAGTEDVSYSVTIADLLAGFSDVDGDTLSVSDLTAPDASVTLDAGGLSYTITQTAANYNGPVTLSYNVVDTSGAVNNTLAANLSYTLSAVNDQPTIDATTSVDIAEGATATGTAVGADAVDNNTALTYTASNGSSGAATIDANTGAWSYTPTDANFNGSDSFTITVDDGSGAGNATATQVVTINVGAVNDAPVSGGDTSASGTEDDANLSGAVPTATDIDSTVLTYNFFGAAPDGVTLNSDGSFTVVPILADQGLDSGETREFTFQYVANDGALDSAPATVTVTINGVNDAPVSGGNASVSGTEDAVITGAVAAGSDADTEALTYSVVGSHPEGVTFNSDGSFSVTPTASDQGLDTNESRVMTFQYVANDGTVDSAPATVTVTINGVNDAPVSGGTTTASGTEDVASISGTVAAATDVDGETLNYSLFGAAPAGVSFNSDGSFSVATAPADQGLDSGESREVTFQYASNDGTAVSAPASVTVTITGVNDAPTGGVTIGDTTPDLNQTLTASNTLADADGMGAISYQWQSSNDSGATWANILGATNANFLTTTAQVGQQLRVSASYSDGAGPVESVNSDATAAVGAFNIINGTIAAETLNGTALQDQINGNGGNDVLNGLGSDDVLFGAEGDDTLNGGLGADAMTGGTGNDVYMVDTLLDSVVELAGGGTADRINSSISYSIALLDNVENLLLTGTAAINATGNAFANTLTGNTAANTLDGGDGTDILTGGLGADNLIGGAGNDVYGVDNALDNVVELAGGGTADRINSSVSYSLALLDNVENLLLTGTAAIDATGNAFANALTGNAAANTLDGGNGNDILIGGLGADSMIGGGGNDTYGVDNALDSVVELAGGGTDRIDSSVSYSLALLDNVENLTLTGTAANSATGNAFANTLTGNAAANTLDGGDGNDILTGGLGADSMIGGGGNDAFVVDNALDSVVELAGGGTADRVNSSISYSLALLDNVENLLLTGTAAINGTGNAFANTLTGNAAANTLDGGDGSDMLAGGLGVDHLTGGVGIDRFILNSLAESAVGTGLRDVIADFVSGTDKIQLTAIDANSSTAANDAFSLIGTGAFGNVAGQLRYFADGGDTVLEGDVNGDGVADFQLQLTGNHTFFAADFLL